MNTIAMKKMIGLAVGFVLLVNAVILGKVYVNRTQVMAQLQLSERELQLPYNYGFTKEDSSARVMLRWTTPNTEPLSPELENWRWHYDRSLQLSDTHFASFKFPDCEKTTRWRHKQTAWLLLEFNGQSYADYVAQAEQYHALIQGLKPAANTELSEKELTEKRKDATEFLDAAINSNSRLFAIDAAAERELLEIALKKRQPTNNATLVIVPAEIQPGYSRCDNTNKKVTEVIINNLAVESLYIPKDLGQGFPRDADVQLKEKFNADIFYGRLHEPWIANLQHCKNNCL